MVRLSAPEDGVRRYRLARLDEIAIASPPGGVLPPEAKPDSTAGPSADNGRSADGPWPSQEPEGSLDA